MTGLSAPHDRSPRDPIAARYALLASAVAGYKVNVVGNEPGPSFSDGETIFAGAGDDRDIRDAVVVQAALLAAGSLRPKTVARLAGRRQLRNRYLTLEVARAARGLGAQVPRIVAERVAQVYDGPVPATAEDSLKAAGSDRGSIPDPPAWFGVIQPSKVLVNSDALAGKPPSKQDATRDPSADQLRETDDDEDTERSKIMELLATPGSRNPLGKALQKMLGMSSSPDPSGSGGDELPVGGQRVGKIGRHGKPTEAAAGPASDLDGAPVGRLYPEWNWQKRAYRNDWCAVAEYDPAPRDGAGDLDVGADLRLHKELARLGLANERHRRQEEGDVLDVTSLIDFVVDRRTGLVSDQRVYETQRRTAHDLGVLILLDATGSTSESEEGKRVFDEQIQVVARLAAALDELGDRVAAYAFQSWGRTAVRFLRIKAFDDRYDHAARRRLALLEPSGFTRLGAAIRHGTHLITTNAGTSNKILMVVGDGLPYDDGYEHTYAHEDCRRALQEAVLVGVGCACLSVHSATEEDVVERVWGNVPYRRLEEPSELASQVAPLFRQALREAAASRRRAA